MDVVQVSWTVDADLVAALRVRARAESLPLSRTVSRVLREALGVDAERAELGRAGTVHAEKPGGAEFLSPPAVGTTDPAPRSVSSSEKLYARAGCPHKIPQGVRCEKPYGCGAVHQP